MCVPTCAYRRLRACLGAGGGGGVGDSHFGLSTFKLREAFVEKMLNKTTKSLSLSPSSGIAFRV